MAFGGVSVVLLLLLSFLTLGEIVMERHTVQLKQFPEVELWLWQGLAWACLLPVVVTLNAVSKSYHRGHAYSTCYAGSITTMVFDALLGLYKSRTGMI